MCNLNVLNADVAVVYFTGLLLVPLLPSILRKVKLMICDLQVALMHTGLNSLGISNWANQALENGVSTSTVKQGKVWCEVCNVVCNSKDVFDKHVTGKKHVKNLQVKNKPSTTSSTSLAGQTSSVVGQMIIGTSDVASRQGLEVEKQTVQGLEVEKHTVLTGGATTDSVRVCTICNVTCNSQEVFNEHIAGKKHAIQVN